MQYENERDATSVSRVRYLRERLEADATHEWYHFPLGRLALEEYITGEELDAGRAWAELTWRHAQIVGLMLPKCRAIDWEGRQGRSLAKEPSEESIESIKARKEAADAGIRRAGLNALSECMSVIICDEPPSNRWLLKRALRNLLDSGAGDE